MPDKILHSEGCSQLTQYIKTIESKVSPRTYQYCDNCFNHCVIVPVECCRTPKLQFVRYAIAGGRFQLRKQCTNCMSLQGTNYKHQDVADFNLVPIASPRPEIQWQLVTDEMSKLVNWLSDKRKKEFFKQHDEYLNTKEWRTIRAAVLKRDNYICQGCLIVTASEVHHTTYERWKEEMAFDLISLCSACHKKIHQK